MSKQKVNAQPNANVMLVNNVKQRTRDRILKVIIVVFGFILYANTLGHGYALDDTVTIWKNEFTQQGFGGIKDILSYDTMAGMFGKDMDEVAGGRYRPLSVVMFAIELEIFGKKVEAPDYSGDIVSATFVGHFFNVIYYCLLLLLMYSVLKKLFRNHEPKYWFLSIPFVTTMLFAAHPLHTEVVANIKSRDEIMAFIFSLLALNCAIDFLQKKGWRKIMLLVAIFVCVFLGSMSKETTVAFVFLIPLTLYFFFDSKFADCAKVALPALLGALLYVVIRANVIVNQFGNEAELLLNNPFLNMTVSEKYATVFYTLLLYLKLLVFPHPLTWDYYPYHIPTMHWTDWQSLLSLAIYVAMIVVAIIFMLPKRKSPYSYALFFFGATLILPSNLLFNVGAFMAERFLFMPSFGFSIAVAYLLVETLPSKMPQKEVLARNIAIVVMSVVLVAFFAKTVTRNMDWKDSSTLFAHDVHVSPNSIKGNSSYASDLYTQSEGAEKMAAKTSGADSIAYMHSRDSLMRVAIPYFEKALEFDSLNSESLVRMGNIYYKLDNDYRTMFRYYKQALRANPLNRDVWNNTVGVLTYNLNEPEYEKQIWMSYAELSPDYYESYYQLGEIYYTSVPQNSDSAILFLEKAYTLNTSLFEIPYHLGMSYGNVGNFNKAKEYLLKADALKTNAEVKKFLGIIYGSEGNPAQAYEYFSQSAQLNPNDKVVQQYVAQSKMEAGL